MKIPAGFGTAGLRAREVGPWQDFDTTPFPKGCRGRIATAEISQIQLEESF